METARQIPKSDSKAASSESEQKFGTKHKEIWKLADWRKFLGPNKLRRDSSGIVAWRIIVNKSQ